jgi:tRNA(Phe) wybutosine-synthesizing methylase Tyw3
MNFAQQKAQFLSKPDKSAKGSIDVKIAALVRLLNSKAAYYTTSSCSGRITLLKEAAKKQKGAILKQWHSAITFSQLQKALKVLKEQEVWLVAEPPILAVACADLEAAKQLVNAARHAGWKKSGVVPGKKIIAELSSPERLELPIVSAGKKVFDSASLKIILKKANSKLKQARQKINKLNKLLSRDSESDELKKKIIAEARKNIGKKYKYGASLNEAPNCFDCSSFVCYIFGRHGISLPRCSIEQIECGKEVKNLSQLKSCDLVFLKGNKPHFNSRHKNGIGHVGIYIGDGKVIHASSRAGKVIVQTLQEFKKKGWRGARRVIY